MWINVNRREWKWKEVNCCEQKWTRNENRNERKWTEVKGRAVKNTSSKEIDVPRRAFIKEAAFLMMYEWTKEILSFMIISEDPWIGNEPLDYKKNYKNQTFEFPESG